MKKFLLAAFAALFVSGSAMAIDNEPEEGLTWQGQVGLNISNLKTKGLASVEMNEMGIGSKPGVNLGAFGRYVLPSCHGAYLKFGLQYNMLGGKGTISKIKDEDGKSFKAEDETTIALHYLDIPVHVGFQYGITEEWAVYADLGPYFGFGVNGKSKSKYFEDDKLAETENISWYKDMPKGWGMKRFDAGIGLNIGGEYMNHYILNFGLDWGLTNQINTDKDQWLKNDRMKNFNFSISVGYRL